MDAGVFTPEKVYQKISLEVDRILKRLTSTTDDTKLQKACELLRSKVDELRQQLNFDIESLQKNTEWDTFTIAFYGETNAGKSTIIETLRILLREPGKLSRQQAFREFQSQHRLTENDINKLQNAISEKEKRCCELVHAIDAINIEYLNREKAFQTQIESITALIFTQRQKFSLWRKFINLWIKTAGQKEKERLHSLKEALAYEKSETLKPMLREKADCNSDIDALRQMQAKQKSKLDELSLMADGEIIGSGMSDFTMNTTLYSFKADGQRFALLDVPGIEGKESKVLEQIESAVEKAHAVFYVTSKPTAPQKGDDTTPGTLDKIKKHLNAQTEVWTLFNKRLTNPQQLTRPALISEDEQLSLDDLNKKMSEQLGDNYCSTWSVSAMPAFLSVAEHLLPGSENAKKRDKLLEKLDRDTILEKTGLKGFLSLLTRQLVSDSKAKITRSNFNKARTTLDNVTSGLSEAQHNFDRVVNELQKNTCNVNKTLDNALASLKIRLHNQSEDVINFFSKSVREGVYEKINGDISNEGFKNELEILIKDCLCKTENNLRDTFKTEFEKFNDEMGDIVERFQKYSLDIVQSYSKLQGYKINRQFDLNVDIDNGVRVTSLIATLTGGALLFWNPAGWIVLAPALAGMVFSFYKAVRGFFSSDYKKSQQRKSADDNIKKVANNIKEMIEGIIHKVFPEFEEKINEIKKNLEEPFHQASDDNHILINAIASLQHLSLVIDASGDK
ncbi:hypothetical protein OVA10_04130 [Lelliottia sp. SL45]|uniref:hypothetical protein n=1 Tax=Enterobacteriaceae TaxID=543 RepID=UPI0015758983|nr:MULTISPECIES: hypothetical protein [Enterobacteriaceae]MCY1697272.1 hypothetical protein [Lelliottia sp. SL45]NTZ37827.1 hypothetical protein [Enterobacter sp. JMULE2]